MNSLFSNRNLIIFGFSFLAILLIWDGCGGCNRNAGYNTDTKQQRNTRNNNDPNVVIIETPTQYPTYPAYPSNGSWSQTQREWDAEDRAEEAEEEARRAKERLTSEQIKNARLEERSKFQKQLNDLRLEQYNAEQKKAKKEKERRIAKEKIKPNQEGDDFLNPKPNAGSRTVPVFSKPGKQAELPFPVEPKKGVNRNDAQKAREDFNKKSAEAKRQAEAQAQAKSQGQVQNRPVFKLEPKQAGRTDVTQGDLFSQSNKSSPTKLEPQKATTQKVQTVPQGVSRAQAQKERAETKATPKVESPKSSPPLAPAKSGPSTTPKSNTGSKKGG